MTKIADPETALEVAGVVGRAAAAWKAHHAAAISRLSEGTTVMIDITTGEYVTGTTWHLALDEFERRFGDEDRPSHSFTVGRPIFIGGGLWPK